MAPDMAAADQDHRALAARLTSALHLAVPPVGIAFQATALADLPAFDHPLVPPGPDGRRGRVPAGCVFWVEGLRGSFQTAPEDHGNCSVGLLTHGLADLEDLADREDVATLVAEGWVGPEAVASLPRVRPAPGAIVYGPGTSLPVPPDVLLLRVQARQLMVLRDALPALRIEGKPQCHIVALAQQGVPAASVGCALSRARTGMRPEEMTCALPGAQLAATVEAVERTVESDTAVAVYAATDARRFQRHDAVREGVARADTGETGRR
jgi:uncharacterized protein (DUF169 family)